MTEKLIDAEAVERYPIRRDNYDKKNGSIDFINGVESVLEYVNDLPTIEAKPIIHAHWKHETWAGDFCSNCGEPAIEGRYAYQVQTNYCPSCGAQMDELVSNTDELKCSEKIPVISMEDVPKLMEE